MSPLHARATGWSLRGSAFAALLAASTAVAGERIDKDADGVAILGYDTVAYFTDGQPVKGSPDFEYVVAGRAVAVRQRRAQDLFAGDPDRYAPQFGGFCTGGMGFGVLAPIIDPEAWVIVDGRLYLHHDKEARDETAADPRGQHRRRRGAVAGAGQDPLTRRRARRERPIADRSSTAERFSAMLC